MGLWSGTPREGARRSTMAVVQRNVDMEASPQETMALVSDASRWPDWYPGMTEIDIGAPFPEEGGKVAFKVKSAGNVHPAHRDGPRLSAGQAPASPDGGHVLGARSLGAHPCDLSRCPAFRGRAGRARAAARCCAPRPAHAQMRTPEYRSGATLLRTKSEAFPTDIPAMSTRSVSAVSPAR